jgi:hypothetical protein
MIRKTSIYFGLFLIIISLNILLAISCRKEKNQLINPESNVQVTREPAASPAKELKKYVEISSKETAILIKPEINSEMIAKARKGDIFKLEGEQNNWYEIGMFSGEYRYILKANAVLNKFDPILPEDKTQDKIYEELSKAEDRSMEEADKKYPLDEDMIKNIDYNRILVDRFKLELFHNYNISPAIHSALVVRGVSKRLER